VFDWGYCEAAGLLLAYAVAFFALAAWRFRFE